MTFVSVLKTVLLVGLLEACKAQQSGNLPITILGNTYQIPSVELISQDFCVRNAGDLGLTRNDEVPGCVVSVSNFLKSSTAQQPAALKFPLTVSGKNFEISSPAAIAKDFCLRNAQAFGITTEELLAGCIGPVAEYIRSTPLTVPKQSKTLKVPLTFGTNTFNVEFSEGSDLTAVAQDFGLQVAAQVGITTNEELKNLVGQVAEYLAKVTRPATPAPQIAKIPVTIGNKQYEIKFAIDAKATFNSVARDFCVSNAASLGITTEAELPGCVGPIADYVKSAVSNPPAPKPVEQPNLIKVPITIGNTKFEIKFLPNSHVDTVANDFCIQNAAALGITKTDELPRCTAPVKSYLLSL